MAKRSQSKKSVETVEGGVGGLAVLGVVEAVGLFADRDTGVAHELHKAHADDGADDCDGDARANAHGLGGEEAPVAVDKAVPLGRGVDGVLREEPRREAAPDAADAVAAEGVERVVVAELCLDDRDGKVADGAHGKSDDERGPDRYEARARSDSDKSDDGTRGGAKHRGLTVFQLFNEHPRQHRAGGGGVCVDESLHRKAVCAERAAGVEAEPAEPEDRGAQHHEGNVVRVIARRTVAVALAEHYRGHKPADAGAYMYDVAAGKINGAEVLKQPAHAPHHVRQRIVDDDGPQDYENEKRRKLHALGDGARDERRGYDGEHHLEYGE